MTKVWIDEGHGGADPGAVKNGIEEEDINLAVGNATEAALKRLGFDVRSTRDTDTTVALTKRDDKPDAWKADLFVSIHANAGSSSARGIEVFHYPTSKDGKRAAWAVYSRLDDVSPWKDRGVKTANFFVLRETNMPAILVELGFVTNTAEAKYLGQSGYRKSLAEAIARGVCDYFGKPYSGDTPADPKPAPAVGSYVWIDVEELKSPDHKAIMKGFCESISLGGIVRAGTRSHALWSVHAEEKKGDKVLQKLASLGYTVANGKVAIFRSVTPPDNSVRDFKGKNLRD